jgi:hypothetical protein
MMRNIVIEYGETLQTIGGRLVQASKDLSFSTVEGSEVNLVKLEHEVSLLERSVATLESVSPPKVIEKEHLELICVIKSLTEGVKFLIQNTKPNAGILTCNNFSEALYDINNKGNIIKNISKSMILKLLNSSVEKDA